MEMTLYLDVDGVIVGRRSDGETTLIPQIERIMHYSKKNFRCFWLTTHGRYRTDDVLSYLFSFSREINLSVFAHIESAPWNTLKTEAIDFTKPFIWVDDNPLQAEIQILERKKCLESWLHIDTYRNISDLTVEKIEGRRQWILKKIYGKNNPDSLLNE